LQKTLNSKVYLHVPENRALQGAITIITYNRSPTQPDNVERQLLNGHFMGTEGGTLATTFTQCQPVPAGLCKGEGELKMT
jgi:hypothetical protein